MGLQGSPEPRTSLVPHRHGQIVHEVGRAVYKPSPARLRTDGWHVQEIVLSGVPDMAMMVPVEADLTGNAFGLARGEDFVKEAEGLVLEELRRVEPPQPVSHS